MDLKVTVAREIPAYAGYVFFFPSLLVTNLSQILHWFVNEQDWRALPEPYTGYEFMKRRFQNYYGTSQLPVFALLASGSFGGVGSI
jgi:hypothetical protein